MYIRKTYIAEDGEEFEYESECRAYENKLFEQLYSSTLSPYVVPFCKGGKPISYANVNDIWFVYVKQVPNWEDEKIMEIWDRVIAGQLTSAIGEYGEGWYFRDDYRNWYSWSRKEESHEQMKRALTNMSELVNK